MSSTGDAWWTPIGEPRPAPVQAGEPKYGVVPQAEPGRPRPDRRPSTCLGAWSRTCLPSVRGAYASAVPAGRGANVASAASIGPVDRELPMRILYRGGTWPTTLPRSDPSVKESPKTRTRISDGASRRRVIAAPQPAPWPDTPKRSSRTCLIVVGGRWRLSHRSRKFNRDR